MSSNTDQAQVLALEISKYDLSSCNSFGFLQFIFPPDGPKPSVWTREYRLEIERALEDYEFDPAIDYIVLVGQMLPLAILVNILSTKYRAFKALVFNANSREYETVLLTGVSNDTRS